MNKIKCPKCATEIEIDKALEGQIESRILIELEDKHRREIEAATKNAEKRAADRMKERLAAELEETGHKAEIELEKMTARLKRDHEKEAQKNERLIEELRDDAKAAKEYNQELREELKKLTEALRNEQKHRESAELEAAKKIASESGKIREEAKKEADESHRLKELELQKQLSDTKKALDEAQRKADQGSEQLQGEVLELELEGLLRREFPLDEIEEVKKGQRGADIKQTVKNPRLEDCGLLLWESKNARWQKDWIAKIKDDVRAGGAAAGIIVSREMPPEYGDMYHLESNVWAVRPRLVPALASALRSTLIQVYSANRHAENRGEKMELLYGFLTGVEFRNRIEAIVDNYNILLREIEKEKRAAELRWGRQEKSIRAVIGNTYGLYGDLQGITGSELQIALLESGEDARDAEPATL